MSPGGAKPLTSPGQVLRFGRPRRSAAAAVGQRVQLLVLDALEHAEHAPGHMVVDRRDLAGPPDQGQTENDPSGSVCSTWLR